MKINVIYYLKEFFLSCFRRQVLWLLCLFFGALSCKAQELTVPTGFQAEAIGGFNLSQLDGDQLSGFNKLGVRAGFRLSYATKQNRGLSFGILYDQRGSSTGIISSNGFSQHISVDYIALPLSYYFDSWAAKPLNRYKIRFYISMIPARLVSTRSSHQSFDMKTDNFKEWDVSIATGIRYALGMRSALDLRIERSLLKIFQPIAGQSSSLQSYLISFQFAYLLNQV